jgi:hypothetical protein
MSPGGVGIAERDHLAFPFVARHAATVPGGPVRDRHIRPIAAQDRGSAGHSPGMFPGVSQIAKRVLRHDALERVFHDPGGHVTLEARSTEDLTDHAGRTGTDAG